MPDISLRERLFQVHWDTIHNCGCIWTTHTQCHYCETEWEVSRGCAGWDVKHAEGCCIPGFRSPSQKLREFVAGLESGESLTFPRADWLEFVRHTDQIIAACSCLAKPTVACHYCGERVQRVANGMKITHTSSCEIARLDRLIEELKPLVEPRLV